MNLSTHARGYLVSLYRSVLGRVRTANHLEAGRRASALRRRSQACSSPQFQPLESRLLLSADALSVYPSLNADAELGASGQSSIVVEAAPLRAPAGGLALGPQSDSPMGLSLAPEVVE